MYSQYGGHAVLGVTCRDLIETLIHIYHQIRDTPHNEMVNN